MTTLRDLLADQSLGLELLVDGDLDRTIGWVHVTELADASPYLVGNELILTAGVWRGRRHSAEDFVLALTRRDVAGIGYGLLHGDEKAPGAVVRACRDHGIPLLLVPVRTPFVAVSKWFVDRLTQQREEAFRDALRLRADLLAAAEVDEPKDALAQVARLLRRATGRDVWLFDDAGSELARAGRRPSDGVRAALRRGSEGGTTEPGWTAYAVSERYGVRIAVACDPDDLEVRERVDAARPVVGLVLARERAVRETERRLAGEVVSLVLGRQLEAAAARMTYYGLDPSQPMVAMVCAVPDRELALRAAERWLDGSARSGVVALRGDELMLLLDARGSAADDIRGAAEHLVRRVSAAAAGTGPIVGDVTALRRSLVQARHACELGRRRGGGIVVGHDHGSDHSLLLALQDQDVLDTFRESLLSRLLAYDADNDGDLEVTLNAFLETGGRWQETAARLHVHVNTLRHRLSRVEQLTHRRLDSTPDRVDLWLALKAVRAGTPST